jgi:uncharacterized protein (TIGR03067 family)
MFEVERHIKVLAFVCLLILCCHAADAASLSGSWQLKYTETGGRKHSMARGVSDTLTIQGSTWREVVTPAPPNMSGFRARFTTDDGKTPKQLDLYITSGKRRTIWKGIYEIQGNTLKVCRTRLASRPTRFISSSDASVIVELYERITL